MNMSFVPYEPVDGVAARLAVAKTASPMKPPLSVNHNSLPGPTVIPPGKLIGALGTAYSVATPAVVMRPMFPLFSSVNQIALSGPVVMAKGPPYRLGVWYSVISPAVVIRATLLTVSAISVNHIAPSGPAVIPYGHASMVGMENSVRTPEVVILPIL